MKYWLITCPRGHAGTKHDTDIRFAIEAETLLDAFTIARQMPSVKHTRFPTAGHQITFDEYKAFREVSAYKRYEQHKSTHYETKFERKCQRRRHK